MVNLFQRNVARIMEVQVALVAILSSLVKTFNKIEIFKFGAQKEATKQVDKIVELFLDAPIQIATLFVGVLKSKASQEKEKGIYISVCFEYLANDTILCFKFGMN
jgi:hypothetical protein